MTACLEAARPALTLAIIGGSFDSMNFGVLFEKVQDAGFPPGYFYAHVPSLGLTTHGLGVDGARAAALDLVRLWLAERKASGEPMPRSSEVLFSTLDISEDALQVA